MKDTIRSPRMTVAVCVMFVGLLALPWAAELVTTKPEEVGLSTDRLTRINSMMQKRIAAGEISGGVTLVARKGRVAHLEAHGVMDTESKRPMSRDAVFRIASMTKPVAGVAIMMMLEEGKLRLTDPVSKYIPQFKDMKVAVAQPAEGSQTSATNGQAPVTGAPAPRFYTVPAEREITIRDLLTHTSGLVSGPMSNSEVRKVARTPTETLADYSPRLGSTPLEFQPGTRWAYSAQAGFDTLGRIVEIVSGQNFDQFLRQRLFDPLGMKEVSFYATETLEPRMPTA
ncbi:MAG TPA: serine hydrolase domain-containing protein, partial [Vicinamibacterales bacterium]